MIRDLTQIPDWSGAYLGEQIGPGEHEPPPQNSSFLGLDGSSLTNFTNGVVQFVQSGFRVANLNMTRSYTSQINQDTECGKSLLESGCVFQ